MAMERGPDLRLSWPHAGDGRRAMVGKPLCKAARKSKAATHNTKVDAGRIVHVSYRDLEMHYASQPTAKLASPSE